MSGVGGEAEARRSIVTPEIVAIKDDVLVLRSQPVRPWRARP